MHVVTKKINGHDYLYLAWHENRDGRRRKRHRYLGKPGAIALGKLKEVKIRGEAGKALERERASLIACLNEPVPHPPLPDKKYSLIYADPPWAYQDKASAGKRGAAHKYPVLGVDEIGSIPIWEIAAPDCLLAMWWVFPQPQEALNLVKAWGFELKTMGGFTWHKKTKHGKDVFGMGNWTRANPESCLFAVRGKPKRASAGGEGTAHRSSWGT